MGGRGTVTIGDVAREAQVSVATVSRVINNIGVVRAETAERVRRTIKRLNYTPNQAARNLRRNESRVILMLAPNFTNPYYANILSGICDVSRELGYIALVYNTYDTLTLKERELTHLIEANKVDGTIILAINHDDEWLDKYKGEYPIVQCSEYVLNSNLPHISVDNYLAAYEMTLNIIALGHRKIGFMGSENRFSSTKLRYQGHCKALQDSGITPRPEYDVQGSVDYSFPSGKAAARELLSLPDRPTAVVCVSDVLALSVIAAAKERGIKVPEQLSVTGFDDVDYTTMFHPYLTTVRIPCYDVGRKAMLVLRQSMQKLEDAETVVYMPHEHIYRESCAKA